VPPSRRSVTGRGSWKDDSVRLSPWPAQSGALLLRDPRPEEADQVVALRNNPVVNRFMLRTHVDPDAYAREWASIPDSDTDFSCVAELNGQLAGLGFLDVTDGLGQPGMPPGTQGVIGYMLQPDLAGRGLGTDLARGLLTAAFDALRLRRVIASCNADNIASARILEKNGMRREQHGVEDSWHADLGWVDGYQYAMLDREWAVARTVR
jgi:RimJ/RimL family protein N-acetyltransferase